MGTTLSAPVHAQTSQPGALREFNYEREFGGERARKFEDAQGQLREGGSNELDRRGGWNNDLSWDRRLLDRPDSMGPRGLNPNPNGR